MLAFRQHHRHTTQVEKKKKNQNEHPQLGRGSLLPGNPEMWAVESQGRTEQEISFLAYRISHLRPKTTNAQENNVPNSENAEVPREMLSISLSLEEIMSKWGRRHRPPFTQFHWSKSHPTLFLSPSTPLR